MKSSQADVTSRENLDPGDLEPRANTDVFPFTPSPPHFVGCSAIFYNFGKTSFRKNIIQKHRQADHASSIAPLSIFKSFLRYIGKGFSMVSDFLITQIAQPYNGHPQSA
ncbi:MAG: hypothetical protein WA112_01205 [Rugosibacter sp.]|jgi:hypothetical protein